MISLLRSWKIENCFLNSKYMQDTFSILFENSNPNLWKWKLFVAVLQKLPNLLTPF